MKLFKAELMPDSSEVVAYNRSGIPLYIRVASLSTYYNIICVHPATGMMILNGFIL